MQDARICDTRLRDQALRAAQSACLNIGEAAERSRRADRARVFAIARGEVSEVAVAGEIALACDSLGPEYAERIATLCARLYALLTGLLRV